MFKEAVKSLLKKIGLYRQGALVFGFLLAIRQKAYRMLEFILSRMQNRCYLKNIKEETLPLPPSGLIYLVTNTYLYEQFLSSGVKGEMSIREILGKNGYRMEEFQSVLDFGCGCGRMMRRWKDLGNTKLFGSDYNPELVGWCARNIPFCHFSVNGPLPPLPYESGQLDFIYAISVFTHITEEMGLLWIKEMDRLLSPGGILYMTVMGAERANLLSKDLLGSFTAGNLIIIGDDRPGSNSYAVFHPETYVRKMLPQGMQVIDFVSQGARDACQDVFLIRKG